MSSGSAPGVVACTAARSTSVAPRGAGASARYQDQVPTRATARRPHQPALRFAFVVSMGSASIARRLDEDLHVFAEAVPAERQLVVDLAILRERLQIAFDFREV